MLFTADDLQGFYSSLGWSKLEPTRIRVHDRTPDDLVMILGDSTTLPEVVSLEQQW
jgi:hypothetical protein